MFEDYTVSVRLKLINQVSAGLLGISGQFARLSKDADLLQARLTKIKELAMFGAGMGVAGFMGLGLIAKALKPAEQYAHQLNIMNMAGMKQKEIAEAVGAAWKTTSTVLTSTVTGNLKTYMDLRNIFGDTRNGNVKNPISAAIADMPELARIGAVLAASSNSKIAGNADDLSFSIAKALDMRNAVSNTAVFNQQAEMMTKVITSMQGRIVPEDYRMLFKYGRQAIPGLSNQFLYEELPTFMMEMKGKSGSGGQGGFGTSLAAFYRFFVQGTMTKSAMAGLQSIGLLDRGVGLRTTTVGTQLRQREHVKDVDLAATDPFLYTQYDILPAIWKKYGNNLSTERLNLIIGQIMKGAPQLAIFAVEQFANKLNNVHRDQALIREAQNSTNAYQMALSSDPNTAFAALGAQWENFKIAMTMGIIPVVVPALISLTRRLNEFAEWARHNQSTVITLVKDFALLSAALGIAGLVTALAGAFTILSGALRTILAITGISGVSAGVAGAGAGLAARTAALGITTAGAGVAGYAGYQFGNYIANLPVMGSNLNVAQWWGTHIYDWLHPSAKNTASMPNHEGQPINVSIQLDGREVARAVAQHQGHAAQRHAQAGRNLPDPNATMPYPGFIGY